MDKQHNTRTYNASLTREQFMFYEMRTTAKLLIQKKTPEQVINQIKEENLFQYPTERSCRTMAKGCIKRLNTMNDESLIRAIAEEPTEVAKQICLYAMMKQSLLVWEFMINVIGEKYRLQNKTFSKIDINVFFMNIQEKNERVASWSDLTIKKLKQIIIKLLVDNGYLDNTKSEILNPVWLNPLLEKAIIRNGDTIALPAFNYFI